MKISFLLAKLILYSEAIYFTTESTKVFTEFTNKLFTPTERIPLCLLCK